MAQHVYVVDYNPQWPERFRKESRLIEKILGDNCVSVHHIGSTAVPGLAAKDIIDILVVVRSLDDADKSAAGFVSAGYEWMGEFGIPWRRYLRKGGDERTHQIHLFQQDDENIRRHLAFRDYLRTHHDVSEEYAALKKDLAIRFPYDIGAYCDGKDLFVRTIEKAALAEYYG